MEGIFIKLLNLSIQASILITVVLLLRFILNKSPKSIKWQSRREKLLLFLQKMNTMERELRFLKKRVS